MSKTAGVVDINGRRYNAVSGAAIGNVIDGFVRRSRPKKPAKAAASAAKLAARPKTNRPARAVRQNAKSIHKRTEHSKTLIRGVLSKPSLSIKKAAPSLIRASAKAPAKSIDQAKLSHAKTIKKHSKVERFGALAAKSAPQEPVKKILSGEVIGVGSNARAKAAASASSSVSTPLPSMITSSSHARLERMLDEALVRADAHKQALRRQARGWFGLPRWLVILIFAIVLLAVGAVIIWRDVPAVAVKVAAMRSHVSATVPTYTPTGFGFNQAISQPGKLTIQYEEKAAAVHNYTVTEQKSDWDSQSLSDNNISKNSDIQTSQVNGNTVYIYGPKSNAAWVNNGTLYTIKNDANLSSDQLLHIAQGL